MTGRHAVKTAPVRMPPILIVGAHRSGTTATARALELLGLQIGQRLDSHREPKSLQRLHEEYLQKFGAAWHCPDRLLEQLATTEGERDCVDYLRLQTQREFSRIFGYRHNPSGWWMLARLRFGVPWGWKEPRTTLFGPCWLQIFPAARVVEVVRHPLAVALSIRERELRFRAAGDPPTPGLDQLEYCLHLALTYIKAGGRLAARTGGRYRRIQFEAMQADARNALLDLAAFCGLVPTESQLLRAAQSIRPPGSPSWPPLTSEAKAALLTHRSAVTELGYDFPDSW